jgi:putative heme degradation protein
LFSKVTVLKRASIFWFCLGKLQPEMAGYLGLTIVKVEGVIVVVVGLDAVQIQEDIIELLEEEEACGHALPSGDRVTLTRATCTVHTPHHLLRIFLYFFLQ